MPRTKTFAYAAGRRPDLALQRIHRYITSRDDVPAFAGDYCDPLVTSRFLDRTAARRLRVNARKGDHIVVADLRDLGVRRNELARVIVVLWRGGLTVHCIEQSLVVTRNYPE